MKDTFGTSGTASSTAGAAAQQQAPNPFENVRSTVKENTSAYSDTGSQTRPYDYGRSDGTERQNYKKDRGYQHSYEEGMEDGKQKTGSDIFTAILSYFGPLWILPLLRKSSGNPPSKFVMFHANQGLVLFILDVIIEVIEREYNRRWDKVFSYIDEEALGSARPTPMKRLMVSAKGQMKPLPIIGGITLIR